MMFCKHEWKMLSEQTTVSALEESVRLGTVITKGHGSLMDRKLIQIVTCEKCGKLERFVEDI